MAIILKAIFEADRSNSAVPFPQPDWAAGFAAFERARKAHAIDGRRLNRVWLIETNSEQGVVVVVGAQIGRIGLRTLSLRSTLPSGTGAGAP